MTKKPLSFGLMLFSYISQIELDNLFTFFQENFRISRKNHMRIANAEYRKLSFPARIQADLEKFTTLWANGA
jgi:hypothetical protein